MEATQLILGSGEIYFEEWIPGTRSGDGERYIGNTPSMQIEKRVEFAESRQSYDGVSVRNFRTPVKADDVVSFTTDNIDIDNLAAWIGSTGVEQIEAPSTPASETITLRKGAYYQLGKNINPVTGARNLFGLNVTVDGATVYGLSIDNENGRIGVPRNRVDLDGKVATVSYEISGSSGQIVSGAYRPRRGSLRFIARNAHGKNRNYYFPAVLMSPRDQVGIKGSEWQSLTFEVDVLAPPTIYESGIASLSLGEQAIIDEGLNLITFAIQEDILNTLTNITIPSRGY